MEVVPVVTDLDWKEELVKLLQLSVDVWLRDGNTLNSLSVDSGLWHLTREDTHYRAKSLMNYLKLEKMPKRPTWNRVLGTAEFVLSQSDTSSMSLELEFSLRRFEQLMIDKDKTPNHGNQKV